MAAELWLRRVCSHLPPSFLEPDKGNFKRKAHIPRAEEHRFDTLTEHFMLRKHFFRSKPTIFTLKQLYMMLLVCFSFLFIHGAATCHIPE